MSTNSINLLKGISATGKGTRLSTILEFLKTKSPFLSEVVTNVVINGSEKLRSPTQLGIYFPELNLIFIGRWVKSNKSGMSSWNSLDGYSNLGNEAFYKALIEKYKTYHMVCEGYFGAKGKSMSVEYLSDKKEVINVNHYYYSDFEQFQERVVGRSGSRVNGVCYKDNFGCRIKNKVPIWDQDLFLKKSKEIIEKYKQNVPTCNYGIYPHTEEVYKFGCRLLDSIGKSEWKAEFKHWQIENNTLRDVTDKEKNKRFSKYSEEAESQEQRFVEFNIYDDRKLDKQADAQN